MNERKYILMSRENPTGMKLEELVEQLSDELGIKNGKILPDIHTKPVAKTVFDNNNRIIQLLGAIKAIQMESLAALNTIGPDQGPTGTPRIGTVTEIKSPVSMQFDDNTQTTNEPPEPLVVMEDEPQHTIAINRDPGTTYVTRQLSSETVNGGAIIALMHTDKLGFDYGNRERLQKHYAAMNNSGIPLPNNSSPPIPPFSAVEYVYRSPHGGANPKFPYLARIKFQDGPIKQYGVNGIQVEDLLALCYTRLALVSWPSRDPQTEQAMLRLTEARMWLNLRREMRQKQQVEGTNRPHNS